MAATVVLHSVVQVEQLELSMLAHVGDVLYVLELSVQGVVKVGEWHVTDVSLATFVATVASTVVFLLSLLLERRLDVLSDSEEAVESVVSDVLVALVE